MAGESFRADIPVLRRNWTLFQAALAPVLLAPFFFAAGVLAHVALFAAFAPLVFLGGLGAVLYLWSKNPYARVIEGLVEASSEGVRFNGELLVRRDAIREGFVVPRRGLRPIVRLVQKSFRSALEIVVDDETQGRALLRALSLDASQTVAHFRLPSRFLTNIGYRIASSLVIGAGVGFARAIAHAGHHGPAAGFVSIAAVLLFVLTLLFTPGRLEVGADGVVTSWLGRKRFVGYGVLQSFERYIDGTHRSRVWGLELVLHSGEKIRIPIGTRRSADDSNMATIEERVREAVETFRRGDGAADAALLRRGARDVSGWMRQLRAIGAGANAAMRTAPIEADRLWRIVEDPSAEASARAGAAVALGGDLDASGKQRLRAAAEAIAQPKVRIAVEAAAESLDDAALAEVLGQIEAEDRGARAQST